MRIHHLNCGTLCPCGASLINGRGGLCRRGRIVCHCLLIEADDGLVLVDTGFGTEDAHNPRRLGLLFTLMGAKAELGDTAIKQIKGLGFSATDVRHIVTTHLDPDHSGGLPDFPSAEVHVFAPELDAALHPEGRDRFRYLAAHWRHHPRWVRHDVEGDRWFGFESVRILPGLESEVALVPLLGHSHGHTGIAIHTSDGWLLHCGDAYFHHWEMGAPPNCPLGLRVFQRLVAANEGERVTNQERLRELASSHSEEVKLICSHDPFELDRWQAASAATMG